jgi:hypothetical protein
LQLEQVTEITCPRALVEANFPARVPPGANYPAGALVVAQLPPWKRVATEVLGLLADLRSR